MTFVGWLVFGLLAGAVACSLVPGAMWLLATMSLGLVGSIAGGLLASFLVGRHQVGLVGAVVGGVVVLLLYRWTAARQSA